MLGDHGLLRKFYQNTHEIDPGKVWRTYQPSPADLRHWKERGIKTVVNLRGDRDSGFLFLEEEACEKLGLTHIPFRVYSREAPSVDVLEGAQRLFESIDYPAILHCKSGADRAGLMSTLYHFFQLQKPMEEAMEQLSLRYGHVRQGKTGVIDAALREFIAYANKNEKNSASPEDLFEWAHTEYDPVRTKKEFSGTVVGRLVSDVILRRE